LEWFLGPPRPPKPQKSAIAAGPKTMYYKPKIGS
jgi:hypothetical protein